MEYNFHNLPITNGNGKIIFHVTGTIDIDEIEFENDGIGPYEFWGAKGFDRGKDYVSDFKTLGLFLETEIKINQQVLESALIEDYKFQDYVLEQYQQEII